MSEAPQERTSRGSGRRFIYVLVLTGFLIILVLGYLAGVFAFPGAIRAAYKDKDCGAILKVQGIYSRIYPSFLINTTVHGLVMECAVYTLAVNSEEQEAWRDSYNAFHVYSETYPNGLFANEAYEHRATSLVGLAKDGLDQKHYAEAFGNLTLVLTEYKDTKAAPDGVDLLPEVYKSWGADLRAAHDFNGAERVFNDFKVWSQAAEKPEYVNSAQLEMAQTYLDWGLSLQAQDKFEEARIKLDMAKDTDPDPLSTSGPASKVESNQSAFYQEWGDSLVELKDFEAAMGQYDTALFLAQGDDRLKVKDAIATGHIHWATDLSAHDDFVAALQQVDVASKTAASDEIKKAVEAAQTEVYLAFSQSSGEQAQQAMKDAVELICKQGSPPKLPIFGLNADTHLAGFYGNDQVLPESVAATTPGEMHYVACIDDVVSKTIQYVEFYGFQMYRFKESWAISLRDAVTGELVESQLLEGAEPDPLPTDPYAIAQGGKIQRYFGRPDMEYLANWLLTVMK